MAFCRVETCCCGVELKTANLLLAIAEICFDIISLIYGLVDYPFTYPVNNSAFLGSSGKYI